MRSECSLKFQQGGRGVHATISRSKSPSEYRLRCMLQKKQARCREHQLEKSTHAVKFQKSRCRLHQGLQPTPAPFLQAESLAHAGPLLPLHVSSSNKLVNVTPKLGAVMLRGHRRWCICFGGVQFRAWGFVQVVCLAIAYQPPSI